MYKEQLVTVIDQDGIQGTCELRALEDDQVMVTFSENHRLLIPKSVLIAREDDTYFLPLSTTHLQDQTQIVVIPVIREELQVSKEHIETGKIRLTKTVHQEQITVDETILSEQVDVQRVPVNRYVDTLPTVRQEDGKTIIPLVEEVLVVEKRLLLREEIHIHVHKENKPVSQEVTLKREDVTIERMDNQDL
jgi:uncharacterized protein (TIGR02271 family)